MPFDTDEKFVWNGYDMIKYELQSHTVNYTHTGTFSRIVATFYLSRIFGQFLLDFYVPIFLYVIISWGSFWVEITAAPARVTLCVTTLLTMVTTAKSARDKLPPVTYLVKLEKLENTFNNSISSTGGIGYLDKCLHLFRLFNHN